jgi:hypothetical protein
MLAERLQREADTPAPQRHDRRIRRVRILGVVGRQTDGPDVRDRLDGTRQFLWVGAHGGLLSGNAQARFYGRATAQEIEEWGSRRGR